MSPNPVNLLIHNIGFFVSSLICIGMIILVFIKDHKSIQNRMFMLGTFAVAIFTTSHLIGVNVADHHLSRNILMFNMANIFITLFYAHCVFAVIGKLNEQRTALRFFYTLSILLFIFYLIYPEGFLHDSIEKMYFPNYYVPGPYHWVMRLFSNTIFPVYFIWVLIRAYLEAGAEIRNRLKYFFTAFLIGYCVGSTAILLVYDIPFDPVWASFFMLFFSFPFTYAVIKYSLLDIKIVAKRAFTYALLVCLGGLAVSSLDVLRNIILIRFPSLPPSVFSFGISFIVVGIAIVVWRSVRDADVLKYEFVNVVTHKFRTPLTHIKWASESLLPQIKDSEARQEIENIKTSALKLTELTNILVGVSDNERKAFLYRYSVIPFVEIINEVLGEYESRLRKKNITTSIVGDTKLTARVDKERIKFVLQILIDNALNYTLEGGTIDFSLSQKEDKTICRITDSGVGIPKSELSHLFESFYRGERSKRIDTEGMGIGLYFAKQIIERHGGSIHAESEGEGKGSTFSFSVPVK